MFNLGLTTYLKIGAIAAIAIAGFAFYTHYNNLVDDNRELTETKGKLEAQLDEKQKALNTANRRYAQIKDNLEIAKVANEKLNQDFKKAEVRNQRMISIFSDHDFNELVKKKPGLITIRMQKATKKVFDEIEEITNE